jgi:hypothetical protein
MQLIPTATDAIHLRIFTDPGTVFTFHLHDNRHYSGGRGWGGEGGGGGSSTSITYITIYAFTDLTEGVF